MNTIYNAKPVWMGDRLGELDGADLAFFWTTESPAEMADVIGRYERGRPGKGAGSPDGNAFRSGTTGDEMEIEVKIRKLRENAAGRTASGRKAAGEGEAPKRRGAFPQNRTAK